MPLTLTPADLVDRNILAECNLAAHSLLMAEWARTESFRRFTEAERDAQVNELGLVMYHAAVIALSGVVNKEVEV